MKTVLNELESNHILSDKLRVDLADMMFDFKQTEVYKVLTLLNNNDIKAMLTMGKKQGQSSDEYAGIMQGIQIGFESRIEQCFIDGEVSKGNLKLKKELKKDTEDTGSLEEEEINQPTSGRL